MGGALCPRDQRGSIVTGLRTGSAKILSYLLVGTCMSGIGVTRAQAMAA